MMSSVYIFLIFFTWRLSECTVNITADPTMVQVGLTPALKLTCIVPKESPSMVTAIHIYHSASEGHNFTDLASISAEGKITIKNPYITNISGFVNDSLTSYLNLTWAYPTSFQAGRYLCNVSLLDERLHHTTESGGYTVNTVKPDFEDVIKELRETKDDVEKKYKSYSDKWKSYVENFTTFYFTDIPVSVSGSTKYLLSKQMNTSAMQADIMCHLLGGFLAEMNPSEKSQIIEALNGTFFTPEILTTTQSSTITTPDTTVPQTTPVVSGTTTGVPALNVPLFPSHADFILVGGSDEDGAGDWVYMRNNQSVQFNAILTPSPGKDCLAIDVNDSFNVVAVPCSEPNRNGTSTYLCQLPN